MEVRFLRSSVSTIPSFRWARWPYQDTYKTNLDAIQRHMIGILVGWRPTPGETFEQFRQRRHSLSSRLATKQGRWSENWACKVKTWGGHVYRNHDAATWSHSLLNFHGADWLSEQRALWSGPGESRTNTRAFHGKVHRRWYEGYKKSAQVLAQLHVF